MQKRSIVEEVLVKIFNTCLDEKFYILEVTPKLTLTLTLTLSLALGLGLGLTRGKTISVEKRKANWKNEYRRRPLGKNL